MSTASLSPRGSVVPPPKGGGKDPHGEERGVGGHRKVPAPGDRIGRSEAGGRGANPRSRRTGRPRNPETDATILTAALEEFGEQGYEGMTVEAVANRAGVGKATIYRRWASKDDLIIAAVEWMLTAATELPQSGNLREDLIALVTGACRLMRSSIAGAIFPRMAGEVAGRTPLGLRYVKSIIAPRRAVVRGLLAGGIATGQLRSDVDVEVMADSLVGPVILRKILGELDETSEDFPERLVTSMFEGWRAK